MPVSEARLELAEAVQGLIDALLRELSRLDGLTDAVNGRRLHAVGVADHGIVNAGLECHERAFHCSVRGADAIHLEAVGHDDALEAHFVPQDAKGLGRQRGWNAGIAELGQGDVRRHDHLDALGDSVA